MASFDELLKDFEQRDEVDLRNEIFATPADGPDPGQAYPHQLLGIRRIELGAAMDPTLSGILHYPTGAGKTRVGMEVIGRALKANPNHRFIWATHTTNLIRQSMVRMLELSRLFPADTTFMWANNADDVEDNGDDMGVVFMTRNVLTEVLDRAGDRRRNHPWRVHLEAHRPMTIIYDECHQLGAKTLQNELAQIP